MIYYLLLLDTLTNFASVRTIHTRIIHTYTYTYIPTTPADAKVYYLGTGVDTHSNLTVDTCMRMAQQRRVELKQMLRPSAYSAIRNLLLCKVSGWVGESASPRVSESASQWVSQAGERKRDPM